MRRKLPFIAIATLLLSVLGIGPAGAGHAPASLDFVVGTDFLCGLPLPSPCPAIAEAPSGDTIEIEATGSFSTHGRTAEGEGTFVHKAPDGSVVGGGTFEVTALAGFHSYGSGVAQDLPGTWGGRAVFNVVLTAGGMTAPGLLWVDCLLGDKIPAGAVEGVRLAVTPSPFGGINFNEEVSGLTAFLVDG